LGWAWNPTADFAVFAEAELAKANAAIAQPPNSNTERRFVARYSKGLDLQLMFPVSRSHARTEKGGLDGPLHNLALGFTL